MNPTFIYLAQNTPKDVQWGRDSRTMLEHSLDKLYANYNDRFKRSIVIFHEGDFSETDQREIARGRGEIRFKEIEFKVPDFLEGEDIPEIWTPLAGSGKGQWGMGHRHMCRFYSIQIFDYIEEMGYDWLCRFDDDSVLHSKVNYDFFEFMEKNGYEYGYRVDSQEPAWLAHGFGETVLAYIKSANVEPTFFYDHIRKASAANSVSNAVNNLASFVFPWRKYHINGAGEYDNWGYFNNFFISKLSFWKSKPVQEFLRHLDRMGANYKWRWNDLSIQSAAVQVFLPKAKVHKFTDWTYEHATIREGKLQYGGVWQGSDDVDSPVVKDFLKRFGRAIAYPNLTY